MKLKILLWMTMLFLAGRSWGATNLLVNGSFESGSFTNQYGLNDTMSLFPGATNISGWTVTGLGSNDLAWEGPTNNFGPSGGVFAASDGSYYLDLTGYHDAPSYDSISQTVATEVGRAYHFSFDLGSDSLYDGSYSGGMFDAPGVMLLLNSNNVFAAFNNYPNSRNYWQTWNFYFVAQAAQTSFTLTAANSGRSAYVGLDNVNLSAAAPRPSGSNLLVNGSFELGGFTNQYGPDDIMNLYSGMTNLSGWTVTCSGTNDLSWEGPTNDYSASASDGSYYLDLTGLEDNTPSNRVSQTVATTSGASYHLSFDLGSDSFYDGYYSSGTFVVPSVTVSLNGADVFTASNNFPNQRNDWQTWGFDFTATAPQTTIAFAGSAAGKLAYIGLDNASLTLTSPSIVLSAPTINGNQVRVPFTALNISTSTFALLQAAQITGPWSTNTSAVLTTNVVGYSYAFTALLSNTQEFYRVRSP